MPSVPRMPWGKFVGQPLSEIDSGYLIWVLERSERPASWLQQAIREELQLRFGQSSTELPPSSASWRKPCPDPTLAATIVSAGLHTLAKKHHPDRGGDVEAMKQINAVADWLRAQVPQ